MKAIYFVVVMLTALAVSAMELETSLSNAELQYEHDKIVSLVKSANNEEILKHLRSMKRVINGNDIKEILNFDGGRSILFHALTTKGVHYEVIEFLLEHGARGNFLVRKAIRKKGRKAQVRWLTANEVARGAGQPENVLELLRANSDGQSISDISDFDFTAEASDEYSSDDDLENFVRPPIKTQKIFLQRGALADCTEGMKELAVIACAAIATPLVYSWLVSEGILEPGK